MGRAKEVHSTDYLNTEAQVLDMMDANLDHLIAQAGDEPITEREFKDIVEYEKFMADGVVIEIHESTDKNAPPVVAAGVNGDVRWFPRGVPIRVRRKHVEVLARSQEMRFKTAQNKDVESDNAMTTVRKTGACYGFSVLKDSDPRGYAWLQRVTRSGC